MREKQSVLFVAMNDVSGKGGDSMATKEMLAAFVNDNSVSTTAVLPRPTDELPQALEGADIAYTSALSTRSVPDYAKHSLTPFLAVRKEIKTHDPDVVVARMHPVLVAPGVLAALHGKPYVLLSRGTAYKTLRFSSVLRQIYKINVRIADEVYAASEEIKRDTDHLRTEQQSETRIFPNSIDPDRFKPIPNDDAREGLGLAFSSDEFVVGFVGSMGSRHTVDRLIRSLEHIDDEIPARLLLVGDGPEIDQYKRLVEERGLADDVVFTGFVPHEDVHKYVSACDIAYGVTEQDSATPIKCFEYLACERPIVVRDIPDLAFVTEQRVGEQVSEIRERDIARAIERLFERGEDEREAMGKRGREYVLENHTWDMLVEMVLDDIRRSD